VKKTLTNGLILLAGLLVMPAATHPEQHVTAKVSYEDDPRLLRLKSFLSRRNCPIEPLAADFIAAADRYNLDWRLLPAIAIMESGGGKRYLNNNIFGWDSCNVRFPSVRSGIHHVASRLATSVLYRDKSLDQVLRTYNPYDSYVRRVKSIMRALGPADPDIVMIRN